MRTFHQRVLVTVMATVVVAVCGIFTAYLLGKNYIIKHEVTALGDQTDHALAMADSVSSEARVVLSALNASPYAYCSDAEMKYFHKLIFQSEYLKDAGRIRNGQLDCSTNLGRLEEPIDLPRPDFEQPDGMVVYTQFTPFRMGNIMVVALKMGDSYVIISPYMDLHLDQPPVHFLSTGVGDPNWDANRLLVKFPHVTRDALTRERQGRVGETLYATRCSKHYYNCVTDFISIADTMSVNRNQFDGQMATGGFVGAAIGFMLSFLYRRNRSMEQQLRRAVKNESLSVVYQPIVRLKDRRIVGAEALLRWKDEGGYVVPPNVFIRLAEERGFVTELTRLAVRHSLADLRWLLRSQPEFRMNVNVAAADLANANFIPMLESELEEADVPAHSLTVEITEHSTADNHVVLETILRLRQMGVRIDIDDFGTGYSSLSYLHDLQVDCIKIDRIFTHAIGTHAVTETILPQILAMAKALGLDVVVEGIETEEQAEFFVDYQQPIYAQGWLFGYPAPVEDFAQYMEMDSMREHAGVAI